MSKESWRQQHCTVIPTNESTESLRIITYQEYPRLAVLDPLHLLVLLRLLRTDEQPVVRGGGHRLSGKLYLRLHQDRPRGLRETQHRGGEARTVVKIL